MQNPPKLNIKQVNIIFKFKLISNKLIFLHPPVISKKELIKVSI